jgi:integrase
MALDPAVKMDVLLEQISAAGFRLEDLQARRDSGAGTATWRDVREEALAAIDNARTLETMSTYIGFLVDGDPREVCICPCTACGEGRHCEASGCGTCFEGLADTPLMATEPAMITEAGRIRAAIARSGPRSDGDGSSAVIHVHGAARHVIRVALARRRISHDPLAGLKNPRRSTDRPARSYEPAVFERIVEELCLGGDDTELDTLLTVFRIETGSRSAGELNLRRSGLLDASCRVRFDEKRGRVVDKPVSRWLMDALLAHVADRGDPDAGADGPVFHYRPDRPYRHWNSDAGRWETRTGFHPVGKSRFTTIMGRIRRAVPEAEEAGFRLHDLRHHVSSVIDRAFGPAAAAAYLNHVPDSPTSLYTRTRQSEVELQHRWITGDDDGAGTGDG